jgi:protein transport protein SEC31
MEDGSLMLWDPAKIFAGAEPALLGQATKHIGPLRCLDFNPFQTNLLASGGSNNDIFIWDINALDKPMAPGAKPTQSQADIMGVAWNRHVSHIMASTSADGMSVVWDLRQSRPIIRFSESSAVKSRCVAVEWSPEAATQLVTASEEDRMPVIQVWDLRNAYSPLRTLEKHARGVLALAWCPKDADMLLSCGKDNRTLMWNPNADVPGGEVVAELPPSMNWNFDVQVCPLI